MRARDLRRLIGTDTLVDCDEAFNINGWTCTEGKVLKYDSRGCFLVSGKWRNKNGTTAIEWYVLPRDIRLHVPAKKSPEVGSAKQPKPAPTFKVGDVVDCDGSYASCAKVIAGEVEAIVGDGIQVKGKWSDGREWRVCYPHHVRHHVAKEDAKPAPHIVPITANIRDAIEAMKRVKTMAEIEIGRLEALLGSPSKSTQT